MGSYFTLQEIEGLLRVTIQIGIMGICMKNVGFQQGSLHFEREKSCLHKSLSDIPH